MENNEQNGLISELIQGRELARQLQMHLNCPSSSTSSQETQELLLRRIMASYENALSMLNLSSVSAGEAPQPLTGLAAIARMSESPPSLHGSPRSEDSDQDPRDVSASSRKRKSMPRWSQQVRVSPGMGLEGPLDDGFSWRKYGQKDILGAKYPRGYYRCTHRNVQGCLATKQVQRSDEDPTIFEITYRGRHTCSQVSSSSSSHDHQRQSEPSNTMTDHAHPQQQNLHLPQQQQSQEILLSFRTGLRVRTEGLDSDATTQSRDQQPIPPFHFPSATAMAPLPAAVAADHNNNNVGVISLSQSFVSPATSGSNYFSPASGLNNNSNQFFHSPESDLTHHEIISAATSATNSPTVNLDFPFDFNPNFSFGNNSGFF